MTTPYVQLEANRIDQEAQYGAMYPQMGQVPPNTQYQPAQYTVQPPGGAPPPVAPGTMAVPAGKPIYTTGGITQYAKKSKSNMCLIICGCFCCLAIIAGVVVGVLFAVAAAQCAKPQFSTIMTQNVTESQYQGLNTVTINNMQTLYGAINVYPAPLGSTEIKVTASVSAASQDAINKLQLTTSIASGELTIEVVGLNKPWSYLARLFACDKANITVIYPRALDLSWSLSALNNHIQMKNMNTSAVTMKTINGEISADGMSSSSLSGDITNGQISVSNSKFGDVTLKGTNSAAYLDACSASNSVSVETVNGLAQVTALDTHNAVVSVKAANGKAIADITKDYVGSYDAKTTNGDTTLNCGVCQSTLTTKKHVTGTVNGGGGTGTVTLATVNGQVVLTFK